MKQQTAVDWLDNEIQNICLIEYSLVKNRCISIPIDKYMELKQKAKEMEKEQMFEAYWEDEPLSFLKYYNETYEN
jgi:hypothetical protein